MDFAKKKEKQKNCGRGGSYCSANYCGVALKSKSKRIVVGLVVGVAVIGAIAIFGNSVMYWILPKKRRSKRIVVGVAVIGYSVME